MTRTVSHFTVPFSSPAPWYVRGLRSPGRPGPADGRARLKPRPSFTGWFTLTQDVKHQVYNSLLLRKLFLKLRCQFAHVRRLTKPLNRMLGRCHIDSHVLTEFFKHLQHCGEFLLGKHADLK